MGAIAACAQGAMHARDQRALKRRTEFTNEPARRQPRVEEEAPGNVAQAPNWHIINPFASSRLISGRHYSSALGCRRAGLAVPCCLARGSKPLAARAETSPYHPNEKKDPTLNPIPP